MGPGGVGLRGRASKRSLKLICGGTWIQGASISSRKGTVSKPFVVLWVQTLKKHLVHISVLQQRCTAASLSMPRDSSLLPGIYIMSEWTLGGKKFYSWSLIIIIAIIIIILLVLSFYWFVTSYPEHDTDTLNHSLGCSSVPGGFGEESGVQVRHRTTFSEPRWLSSRAACSPFRSFSFFPRRHSAFFSVLFPPLHSILHCSLEQSRHSNRVLSPAAQSFYFRLLSNTAFTEAFPKRGFSLHSTDSNRHHWPLLLQ